MENIRANPWGRHPSLSSMFGMDVFTMKGMKDMKDMKFAGRPSPERRAERRRHETFVFFMPFVPLPLFMVQSSTAH